MINKDNIKLNLKLRLQNKATLTGMILQLISIIYMVLTACGVTPSVNESVIVGIVEGIIGLLVFCGVVIDPTTQGISDSQQAMEYEEPKVKEDEC